MRRVQNVTSEILPGPDMGGMLWDGEGSQPNIVLWFLEFSQSRLPCILNPARQRSGLWLKQPSTFVWTLGT